MGFKESEARRPVAAPPKSPLAPSGALWRRPGCPVATRLPARRRCGDTAVASTPEINVFPLGIAKCRLSTPCLREMNQMERWEEGSYWFTIGKGIWGNWRRVGDAVLRRAVAVIMGPWLQTVQTCKRAAAGKLVATLGPGRRVRTSNATQIRQARSSRRKFCQPHCPGCQLHRAGLEGGGPSETGPKSRES